ncbi:MAG: DUF6159 family protein [Actinomycetota bacterium]|nr:DUF6159 family protein [Actinomycetota bacterium]
MSRWGDSRQLTTTTYELVRTTPGMNRWTVRAAVHGAIAGGLGVALGFGIVVGGSLNEPGDQLNLVALIAGAIVVVLGLLAGSTAANIQMAGLVQVTDDVLHGREVDESAARAAAHSRKGALLQWSAISMVVGALVSFIRGDGESGVITSIVRALLAGLLAAAWAVVTTLVMPVIVLERLGGVAAVKRSASIIRTTWGQAVMGSVRIGARIGLKFTLPGLLLLGGGVALAVGVDGTALIALGAVMGLVGAVLILLGAIRAATCRTVFGVALYRWATGEGALGPFTDADLRGAVTSKSTPVAV